MNDPLFSIAGRVAIITGATGGIGSMIARGLVERGARTYIVGRSEATTTPLVKELSSLGECRAIVADVSTTEGRSTVAREFEKQESKLHILINNAGALSVVPFDDVTESDWDHEFQINVKGAFFLTQALIKPIRAAGTPALPATIINTGSVGGTRIRPRENYAYQASKAAIHHLTLGMARHFGPHNITVNAIAPGTFPSSMMPLRASDSASPDYQSFIQTIPRRRLGEPEDLVGAIVFLASRAGAYVNGEILALDGGLAV